MCGGVILPSGRIVHVREFVENVSHRRFAGFARIETLSQTWGPYIVGVERPEISGFIEAGLEFRKAGFMGIVLVNYDYQLGDLAADVARIVTMQASREVMPVHDREPVLKDEAHLWQMRSR